MSNVIKVNSVIGWIISYFLRWSLLSQEWINLFLLTHFKLILNKVLFVYSILIGGIFLLVFFTFSGILQIVSIYIFRLLELKKMFNINYPYVLSVESFFSLWVRCFGKLGSAFNLLCSNLSSGFTDWGFEGIFKFKSLGLAVHFCIKFVIFY